MCHELSNHCEAFVYLACPPQLPIVAIPSNGFGKEFDVQTFIGGFLAKRYKIEIVNERFFRFCHKDGASLALRRRVSRKCFLLDGQVDIDSVSNGERVSGLVVAQATA